MRGKAGNDSSSTAEGSGVVTAMIGIGLPDVDAVHGGAEHGRRDLTMHRVRAVTEFGRSNDELVAAVLAQRRARIGKVSTRRDRIDHAEGNALSDKPVWRWRRIAAVAIDRLFDQSEALIEAIAAILNVGAFRGAGRDHRI